MAGLFDELFQAPQRLAMEVMTVIDECPTANKADVAKNKVLRIFQWGKGRAAAETVATAGPCGDVVPLSAPDRNGVQNNRRSLGELSAQGCLCREPGHAVAAGWLRQAGHDRRGSPRDQAPG